MRDGLADMGHGHGGDHVGGRLGEGPDLLGVVLLRLVRGHQLRRVVAVAARADTARDDHRRRGVARGVADLLGERDRRPVGRVQFVARVPEPPGPVGVRAPGGRVEDEPRPLAAGDVEIGAVVVTQRPGPVLVPEQVERREVRQVDPAVEYQRGLEPAVADERPLRRELRKLLPVLHEPLPEIVCAVAGTLSHARRGGQPPGEGAARMRPPPRAGISASSGRSPSWWPGPWERRSSAGSPSRARGRSSAAGPGRSWTTCR